MSNKNKINTTQDFETVLPHEQEWIAQRRQHVKDKGYGKPEEDSTGLGLSGGGIRSATFNLGLLQALERYGVMKGVDYLSTVSGGGFIGSCYTWLKHLFPESSPFGTSRSDFKGQAGENLAWLRSHGKYLTAGEGLSGWSLAAAAFTGILANLLVIVPVMLLLFYFLTRQLLVPASIEPLLSPILNFTQGGDDGFAFLLLFGVVSLGLFMLLLIFYMSTTAIGVFREFLWQRNMRRLQGATLMFGVFFILVGTIPLFHQYVAAFEQKIIEDFAKSETASLGSYLINWISESTIFITIVTGVFSILMGHRSSQKPGATPSQGMLLINVGLSVLIYGMFLLSYELMKEPNDVSGSASLGDSPWFWLALLFSFYLAIFGNVNMVSMHRYYRNRLMEAFMPAMKPAGKESEVPSPDRFCIYKEKPTSDAPLHIINTVVNMVGSADTKLQGRGGDNFVFSPLFCGAESTGYVYTNQYVGNTMDLATAMAISGAAVNPNSIAARSRPVSFVMTLLNLRLGYWIRNPKHPASFNGFFSRPWWYIYMLREMFGRGLNENYQHIHLADGGHLENLALYELVRRRCRFIIISDAGADPKFDFSDLAKVIEMVRVDFGAKITLSTDDLVPQGDQGLAKSAFTIGSIKYIDREQPAKLIYIKTTVTRGLPEDIYGYRRGNPSFPDESTSDQFFDESQFEAYRELGFQIGRALCGDEVQQDMPAFFNSTEQRLKHDENQVNSNELAEDLNKLGAT
ncbi:MAG: hypothetical protein ACN4GM_15370 [Gammaproteobacteria bacterium]